ncbi:uncharacterized protein [Lepeophtheirus salmonis]|uniref:uncharacterized protein n=1 Tax=Lepeophtheirus salmonis TaxID=72036 RepID=UPI001AE8CD38|nr:kinesin-like protein KIN-12F [Lepeophtheirus salmonis]XP_040580516.1 kinesin-like protein KIN-12F [Lepeophtheirus salmonis]
MHLMPKSKLSRRRLKIKKESDKKCSLCNSSKHLLRVEEGLKFRVNEAIDIELYLNDLLSEADKISIVKPILLCPLCYNIVKKYIEQKSRIASLEAARCLDDSNYHRKKLSDLEIKEKAFNAKVAVRLKKLQEDNDVRKSSTDKVTRVTKKSNASSMTDPIQSGGADVETYQLLLGERDKELAKLDRYLKSTAKVKDLAIEAQNKMKKKNDDLEKKIQNLEKAVNLNGNEKTLIDEICRMNDNLDIFKSENDILNKANSKLVSEVEEIREKMISLEKIQATSEELAKKLSLEKSNVDKCLLETNLVLKEKEDELSEKGDKIEALNEELIKLKKDLRNCIQVSSNLVNSKSISSLKEEIAKKDIALKQTKGKISEREAELTTKAKRIISFKIEKSKLEKRIMEFEKIFSNSSDLSSKQVTVKLKEQADIVSKLKTDLINANKEIESREIDNAETLALLNSEMKELKKDLVTKNEKLKTLDSSTSSLKISLTKIEGEKNNLVSVLQTIRGLENKRSEPSFSSNDSIPTHLNNSNNRIVDKMPFNPLNATDVFGVGITVLSQSHQRKCFVLSNNLFLSFSHTYSQFRGGTCRDKNILKKIYDHQWEIFSKQYKSDELSDILISILFSETFFFFFGNLPEGKIRRKLKETDKLLKNPTNMSEAAEIVVTTPILIDVLDNSPTSLTSSVSTTNSISSVPSLVPNQGNFIRLRSDLVATTSNRSTSLNSILNSNPLISHPTRNFFGNIPNGSANLPPRLPPPPPIQQAMIPMVRDLQMSYSNQIPLQPIDHINHTALPNARLHL